jgi:hypothetical protein
LAGRRVRWHLHRVAVQHGIIPNGHGMIERARPRLRAAQSYQRIIQHDTWPNNVQPGAWRATSPAHKRLHEAHARNMQHTTCRVACKAEQDVCRTASPAHERLHVAHARREVRVAAREAQRVCPQGGTHVIQDSCTGRERWQGARCPRRQPASTWPHARDIQSRQQT